MQVNLSTNTLNPVGEAKPMDASDSSGAGDFLSQIGQILNRQDEDMGADGGAASSAASDIPGDNDAESTSRGSGSKSFQSDLEKKIPDQTSVFAVTRQPRANIGADSPLPVADRTVVSKTNGAAKPDGKGGRLHAIRDEDKMEAFFPFPQFSGDPSAVAENAKSLMALEAGAQAVTDGCTQVTNLQISPAGTGEAAAAKKGPAVFSEIFGIEPGNSDSGKVFSASTGRRSGLGRVTEVPDPQNPDTAQPAGTGVAKDSAAESEAIEAYVSAIQEAGRQRAVPVAPEKDLQPFSVRTGIDSKTAAQTVLQDKAATLQLNFDFMSTGAPALRQEAVNVPAGKIMDSSLPDAFALTETEEAGDALSPMAISNNSSKARQPLWENGDTAGAPADQGQAASRFDLWALPHGKTEGAQAQSGRNPTFTGSRQPEEPFVFAASPAPVAEASGAGTVSPTQSSTTSKPEFVLQLADQIHIQLRDGKGEIRIQLKPDSFGRLEIKAENTLHGVAARISTESGAVKSYLENNLQLLQQTLQDQGLKIDRIHIVVQDALDSQSSSGFTAQFGHAGPGHGGRDSQSASGKLGSLSVDPAEDGTPDPAAWLALDPNKRFYTVA